MKKEKVKRLTEQKEDNSLNPKQKAFCEYYVVDNNGSAAAIKAGYSKNTAASKASQLLIIVKVKDYIEKLRAEIAERNKITIDECVGLLSSMARFDIADLYKEDGSLKALKDIPQETRLAIAELSVFEEFGGFGDQRTKIGETKKLKVVDRKGTIVELMKHLGGYEKDNKQKQIILTDSDRAAKIADLEKKMGK